MSAYEHEELKGNLTTRSEINRLSGIYLVTNLDGAHTEKEMIGCIDQHPFIVLHQLLSSYYISGYGNDILYPAYLAPFKYSLYIKDEGYSYNYRNIDRAKIKDIDVFCNVYSDIMDLCKVSDNNTEEYLNLLQMCLNNNKDLQSAIDLADFDGSVIEENKEDSLNTMLISYYTEFKKIKGEIGWIEKN